MMTPRLKLSLLPLLVLLALFEAYSPGAIAQGGDPCDQPPDPNQPPFTGDALQDIADEAAGEMNVPTAPTSNEDLTGAGADAGTTGDNPETPEVEEPSILIDVQAIKNNYAISSSKALKALVKVKIKHELGHLAGKGKDSDGSAGTFSIPPTPEDCEHLQLMMFELQEVCAEMFELMLEPDPGGGEAGCMHAAQELCNYYHNVIGQIENDTDQDKPAPGTQGPDGPDGAYPDLLSACSSTGSISIGNATLPNMDNVLEGLKTCPVCPVED